MLENTTKRYPSKKIILVSVLLTFVYTPCRPLRWEFMKVKDRKEVGEAEKGKGRLKKGWEEGWNSKEKAGGRGWAIGHLTFFIHVVFTVFTM